ncbi:uncharacterized protein [Gossypium hirsutum]|uniref:G-patch domain-containing protein n=1 Tax=Gossypium hirsutum TaxID=3635 RepID=A0A1U8NMU4_GOSHI|nr:uncharacterized protein LOC107950082 [Gossypium hirsutum]
MDQRLEKLEQYQKEMQDRFQLQMQERLDKMKQEMSEKMRESQEDIVAKLTRLITKGVDKGKGPMADVDEGNDDELFYPPGFTPPHEQAQAEYPRKSTVTIMPQQFRAGISNLQTGSGFNPENNPVNPAILDFDEVAEKERIKVELSKQLEDRCKWLEEKFKAMEVAESYRDIDAKELSLVPDLVLPHKFKMPEFEKYNGTSCPAAHITMFCRRMTGYVNNDQLLIHCFQDNLTGAASKWYNQLSRATIGSWRDLAQSFIKQYSHVTDMAPDRITFQNMEKKPSESFRQYAQRWREVAVQVQPPLLEKEMTMLFINTLKAPSGKIDVGESNRRSASRRKESEVNNTSMYNKGYSKSVTVSQPGKVAASQQNSSRQEVSTRRNVERPQFTPIPMSYRELYRNLFDAHVVSPFYLKPLQPPYPKWYDANAQCDYHAGITGHSIENCTAFKKLVERLIGMGVVKFDEATKAENPLPDHTDSGINMVGEDRRIKADIADVKTPLRRVWREMVKRGLIVSEGSCKRKRNYCEFHHEVGHEIQECTEFRAQIQGMMDNREVKFCEGVQEESDVCASELALGVPKVNRPVVIISRPQNSEVGARKTPKVIIQKPTVFTYKDNRRVPWNYDCNVTIPGKEDVINREKQDEGRHHEQMKAQVEPIGEETSLHKQPARISVLALLLNSEGHRNALLKVLNETYVADDISVNKLDRLVCNISADNFISFSDNEIPPGGMGSTRALHITARCKGCILPGVLVDNGSALNVLPLSTLNRLPVDSSHMKSCQNVVRAFDGTERKVMGRIDIPLLIGPTVYEVDFLVMGIKPSYSCLLGRPWIHSAGAVPSSLHQKLNLVSEGRVVTIDAEEDIIASVTNDAPYLETSDDAIECSFRSLKFVNATFILEGNKIPIPRISKTTRMGLQLTVGKGALPGKGLGRYLQGRIEAPVLKDKQDRFGLGYKPDARQRKIEQEKKCERRRARLTGDEVELEPMTFPHLSKTFISGGFLSQGVRSINTELESIHAVYEEATSYDINDTNVTLTNSEFPFERNMCLEGSHDFEDVEDCGLSPDLLKMVEQAEKQILPHRESIEIVSLEEGYAGAEYRYRIHRLPIREDCKPMQQKLRRMRPDIVLKIKEEVQKQFDVGFLQEVKYSEWVANIVPVPKKDGKVRMCVDYRDLNKASPKDNFPLPHVDTLVDNTAGFSLFSFMDGFSGYNQINMHPDDMRKITFITLWGTFCYKVMPFGLKNVGATYQRAMVALFHDMMHREIEVYVDDMIAKSRTEEEHVQVLRKLFSRLRKFQLKLNPAKCTFGARSGKLLGFLVSKKGIEIDPDKVKAIRDLPSPRTQKEVRGFLGRLNYIARGEWETRDPKLISYRKLVLELIKEFEDITFCYLPRDENQMADALATLASMIKLNRHGDMKPIQMSIYEDPAHCYNIEEGEIDDSPWYQDILRYVKNREYPGQATENEKRTLRRLAIDYVLDGEILYKRGKDQVLLRCVDAVEAKKFLEEVHEGICGTHASGFTMARQIMRFGTSTGATPFSLVYGMEAVLPIEVEIPSFRVLTELHLDEAEWVQSRYDQLNLVEGKRLKAIQHGQMYQKRMMRAYNKKLRNPKQDYCLDLHRVKRSEISKSQEPRLKFSSFDEALLPQRKP